METTMHCYRYDEKAKRLLNCSGEPVGIVLACFSSRWEALKLGEKRGPTHRREHMAVRMLVSELSWDGPCCLELNGVVYYSAYGFEIAEVKGYDGKWTLQTDDGSEHYYTREEAMHHAQTVASCA